MENQTAVVESSATEVQPIEVDRGPLVTWTAEQRADYRKTGEMPTPPKKTEEAAPSSEAKPAEISPAPEAEIKQEKPAKVEKPKPTAEERIAQLEATIEKIRKGAGIEQRQETKPQEQPKPIEPQPTRTKPTAEDKEKDGTPKYKTYEDFVEDLADWKAEQRQAAWERSQQERAQRQELDTKVADAKQRYGESAFDEVIKPTTEAIVGDRAIPDIVKARLSRSNVMVDLIFTIGGDAKELATFQNLAKTDPFGAIDYIVLTESLIRDELAGKQKSDPPPAKPQTQAPKPPAEVGGRAATPGDALESAVKAGDYRTYAAEANRRALARLKG